MWGRLRSACRRNYNIGYGEDVGGFGGIWRLLKGKKSIRKQRWPFCFVDLENGMGEDVRGNYFG